VGIALAAALAFAACSTSTSSSACGSGTPPNVVGTYKLASYTLGTTTIDTTQGASGQLRFHATTYGFNATIPVTGAIGDSGTYAISGVRCMTETSVMGQGSSSGTFTLNGTTPGSIFTFAGTNTALGAAVGFVAVRQ
jgi:hypothetical protein